MKRLIFLHVGISKKINTLLVLIITSSLFFTSSIYADEKWVMDKELSIISFELPVLFAKNVRGTFQNIEGLIEIDCSDCTSLTSIPNIEGLEKLTCYGCTSLTSIPNIKGLESKGCPWINPNQERMNKLIKLQRWFDRYLLSIKIDKFIPIFEIYWFSPEGPGGRSVIRRLNEMKLEMS